MSCFKEGANHTRQPGRGGRRSREKNQRAQTEKSLRALLKGAAGVDPGKRRLASGSSGSSFEDRRCVKRLRSLERIIKDQPCESQALPMKIGKEHSLSRVVSVLLTG